MEEQKIRIVTLMRLAAIFIFICALSVVYGCGNDSSDSSDGDNINLCQGNDASGDSDADGVCDDIDVCQGDDATGDTDSDGICDDVDNCPAVSNADQTDTDGDGIGDACDGDGPVDTTVAAGEWAGTITDTSNPVNPSYDLIGLISTDGQFRFVIYDFSACYETQFWGSFSDMNGNNGLGNITGYKAAPAECEIFDSSLTTGTFTLAVDGDSLGVTYTMEGGSG